MGILSGNPKDEPLHSGEIYHMWSHLLDAKGTTVTLEILINHCGDSDLKNLLNDYMQNCIKQEVQQVEVHLKQVGVRLPPAPPDRPDVELRDIPAGARFNDPEIAAFITKDIIAGRMLFSFISGLSIREDITDMYNDFNTQRTDLAAKVLKINKDKGWLVPPPLNIK